VIEVYAITDRDDMELPGEGGLERVAHGAIAGVYAQVAQRPQRASAEALWQHERVVERLMDGRAVLPLRYGTVLASERELEQVLADRAAEFTGLLDAVRGRVELALRVLDEPEAAPAREASSGRAYMDALARRRQRGDETAALLAPLEEIADATRKRESAAGDLTRWAFLVERRRLDEFNARLAELRSSHPELRMTCTGPWPPYTFVTGER